MERRGSAGVAGYTRSPRNIERRRPGGQIAHTAAPHVAAPAPAALASLALYLLYVGTIYYLYEVRGLEYLDLTMAISTVLGISVSLLLGFRTNAAYDRWWEARKIVGAPSSTTAETLVRQLLGFVAAERTPKERRGRPWPTARSPGREGPAEPSPVPRSRWKASKITCPRRSEEAARRPERTCPMPSSRRPAATRSALLRERRRASTPCRPPGDRWNPDPPV